MDTRARGSVIAVDATIWLHDGWTLARSRTADPGEWREALVPGTVAASLKHDIGDEGPFDADEWWYRKVFPAPAGERVFLRFDGLATLAAVYLNGTRILVSRNMFLGHRVDVTPLLREENELVIHFEALETALEQRRPRPRWKTALVARQNLRWFRTTLLGRMPGWSPPVTPVGPWGPIALECADRVDVSGVEVQAWAEGSVGRLRIRAAVDPLGEHAVQAARVRVGDEIYPLALRKAAVEGDLSIADAPLWWPHTHGAAALLPCQLELQVDGTWHGFGCGAVGFKSVSVDSGGGQVRFRVNGVPVFCRGACWTTADFLRLRADPADLRRALETARDAGLNMLRIGGTMTYESDDFYRLCDELGILVWQDFMFANMDYPFGDAEFLAEAEAEVRHQLGRLQRHACIAAYCGGSEIAQQSAMLGLPAGEWCPEFFATILRRHCAERHPGIPYFPSTPWGGALPFHVGTGIAHYYGVGAYRRPLADVKNARVKFATECLGFSNVPAPEALTQTFGSATPAPHHPRWKARVPRDNGAGYDFEDVRDHYLQALFGVDPVALRSQDLDRYYAVSRVVSGEAMGRVFSEWRSPASECGGGLVWFFRDLWPGAGWGITDSAGRPKAAYWYLKRAWQAVTIRLTDEGLDGLAIHLVNDSAEFLDASVELEMLHGGRVTLTAARKTVLVPARGALTLSADALLGHFTDSTNAYRFGPPKHDVVAARLVRNDTGEVLGEDFHFPAGMDLCRQRGATIDAHAEWRSDGSVAVTLKSDTFLQATHIACEGFTSSDNYFHLSPSRERTISFYPAEGATATMFRAHIEALNLADTVSVRAQRHSEPGR
jgi:beta-mannosidase